MSHSTDQNNFSSPDFIISPHEICQSCARESGPRFSVTSPGELPFNKLRNNYIPTADSAHMRNFTILRLESEISLLDAEIATVKQSLLSLENRRNELYQFTTQQKSVFAPVRKLPVEVLERIFLMCQANEKYGLTDVYNRTSFVRVGPLVCVHWRAVSMACHLLWARFTISPPPRRYNEPRIPGITCLVRQCLENSGELPLSLRLKFSPDLDYLEACVPILARSIRRWENVFISGYLVREFDRIIYKDVQLVWLKSLTISCDGDIQNETGRSGLFRLAPLLTRLELHRMYKPSEKLLGFPWGQITHFEDKSSVLTCNAIKSMISLKYISLHGSCISHSRDFSFGNIQSLTITGIAAVSFNFVVPRNLKMVHIERPSWHEITRTHTLLEFIQQTGFNSLQSLVALAEESLAWYDCPELETVTSLHIGETDSTAIYMKRLTRNFDESNHNIFPRLTTFKVTVAKKCDELEIGQAIIDMIISRLPPSRMLTPTEIQNTSLSYLESVSILFEQTLDDSDIRLRALADFIHSELICEAGVEIKVVHTMMDRWGNRVDGIVLK